MTRIRRICRAGVVVTVVALGCEKSLPTAPSELTTGVTLYEHANFAGESAHLTSDVRDLKDFKGPCAHQSTDSTGSSTTYDWDDCASSLRVAPGWRAQIYRDDNFGGQSLSTTQDVANLQLVAGSCDHDGLNDCVTSVRVTRQ